MRFRVWARSEVMGIKRYELSEEQWLRIEPLLPGKAGILDAAGRATACS